MVAKMKHLQFKTSLCEALLEDKKLQDINPHIFPPLEARQEICTFSYSTMCCLCVVYVVITSHFFVASVIQSGCVSIKVVKKSGTWSLLANVITIDD